MTDTTKLCTHCGSVNALSTLVCTQCKKVWKMPPNSKYWTYGLKPTDRETDDIDTEPTIDDQIFEVKPSKRQIRKVQKTSLGLTIILTSVIVLWALLVWVILRRPL